MKNILAWLLLFVLSCLPSVSTPQSVNPPVSTEEVAARDSVRYNFTANQLRQHSVALEVLVPLTPPPTSTDPSAVQIFQWRKLGSGTLVSIHGEPNILTAWHVAQYSLEMPMRACPVLAPKSTCVDLTLPWMTELDNLGLGGDWALFQLLKTPEGMTPAKFRHREMVVGEPIYIMASPANDEGMLTAGIISGFEREGSVSIIKSDAFAFFGSSGGGLYDSEGYLLGVVVALEAPGGFPLTNVNFSVPVAHIVQFLKSKE